MRCLLSKQAYFVLQRRLLWKVNRPSSPENDIFVALKPCFYCSDFSSLQVRNVKIFYRKSGALVRYLHLKHIPPLVFSVETPDLLLFARSFCVLHEALFDKKGISLPKEGLVICLFDVFLTAKSQAYIS